jgi:hypothetical protein
MAMNSNLETFMASIIAMAIESDPGLLLGAPRMIDGVSLLKQGTPVPNLDEHVEACTRGDWQSRVQAYRTRFGSVPSSITDNIGELEKLRTIRNKVGHALGRDIQEARKHGTKTILPMEKLSRERVLKYKRLTWAVAKDVDRHLLAMHIGEFQAIHFYHRLYPQLSKVANATLRANALKKELGRFKAALAGKLFSKGLVSYYEQL